MADNLLSAVSKLRKRETLSFRPDNDAQDELIHAAQKATGIKMSELLRLACLRGLPAVVADIVEQQRESVAKFDARLRETSGPPRAELDTHFVKKSGKHGTPTNQ